MTPTTRKFLALGLQRCMLRAGDVLDHGDDGNVAHMVISGRVRCGSREGGGKIAAHYDIGRGGCVGSLDMLAGEELEQQQQNEDDIMKKKEKQVDRTMNEEEHIANMSHDLDINRCFAVRDTEAVRISKSALDEIVARYPHSALPMARSLARQERLGKQQSSNLNFSTICIVPAGVDTRFDSVVNFGKRLYIELSRLDSTLFMSSRKLDKHLGRGSAARLSNFFFATQVSQWLVDEEESYRFQVLVTDATWTPWSRVCMRQADCVILVADAACKSAEMGTFEKAMLERTRGFESFQESFTTRQLVLVHGGHNEQKSASSMKPPRRTRDWIRYRPLVSAHYHVRANRTEDIARVARCLAGQAVGVVLGGGGSKGLAHVGVLRELAAQNIPIDYVCGTSQGAFIAARYASTLSTEMNDLAPSFFLTRMSSIFHMLSSATLPLVSLFSGFNFNVLLRKCFADTQIEDLWLPYFCVTTNVTNRRMQVHSSGPLWRYVRASMSVIGLLPPIPFFDCADVEGENVQCGDSSAHFNEEFRSTMLVDGGYVNNLPVDCMEETFSPGVAIVVDVECRDPILLPGGDYLSGWSVLLDYLLVLVGIKDWTASFHGIHGVLLQVASFSTSARVDKLLKRAREEQDGRIIYVRPRVQENGLLAYENFRDLASTGQLEARRAIAAWKEKQRRKVVKRHFISDEAEKNAEMHAAASLTPTLILLQEAKEFYTRTIRTPHCYTGIIASPPCISDLCFAFHPYSLRHARWKLAVESVGNCR